MKHITHLCWVGLFLVLGCKENAQSFFIEHVKSPPDPPDCTVNVSDPIIAMGTLDLMFRNSYQGTVLVTNAMIMRESTNNLVAESNGIFIDGVETYVRDTDGIKMTEPDYVESNMYLKPESSEIYMASVFVSAALVSELADQYGCPYLPHLTAYPPTTVPNVNRVVYGVARLLGHTQGGDSMITPEFTFPIQLCCGCGVDWAPCLDECERFCNDSPKEDGMCVDGVVGSGAGLSCSVLYANADASWPCLTTAGAQTTCTCDSCN